VFPCVFLDLSVVSTLQTSLSIVSMMVNLGSLGMSKGVLLPIGCIGFSSGLNVVYRQLSIGIENMPFAVQRDTWCIRGVV